MIQWVAIGLLFVVAAGYVLLIKRVSPKREAFLGTVGICALAIVVSHTILDAKVLCEISLGDKIVISNAVLAVAHSLELFLFQTHIFDNGYQGFLFGEDYINIGHPWILYFYVLLFVLAAITSGCFLFRIIFRRSAGRTWLKNNQKATVFVFFGGDKRAKLLAEDLKQTQQDVKLLYVTNLASETESIGLSVWDIIKRRLLRKKPENFGPFDAVVFAKEALKDVEGQNIYAQMGLDDLAGIMGNKDCNVFLLSEDTEANLHCAGILLQAGCKADIYCRASREGVNGMYEEAMSMTAGATVHLVDESFLAVRNLKKTKELLPVNYVEKGKDEQGRLEGWVDSAFNSLILGFGERGRETLGFLYEYGAFIDKKFKKSPFSCTVMDSQMDNLSKDFCVKYPGMTEQSGVYYKHCDVHSDDFWNYLSSSIMDLNYIVVCLGDDRLNLNVTSEILSFALREGRDLSKNFVILVAQEDSDDLNVRTLNHLNSIPQYNNCIHCFGGLESVWKYQVINDSSLDGKAKDYYAAYETASSGTEVARDEIWNARVEAIRNRDKDYKHRKDLIRKQSQDYANVLHAPTKLSLLGPEIMGQLKKIAEDIPKKPSLSSMHYTGSDAHVKSVLNYLAQLEHIRWEASHVVMGYKLGDETDAVKKTHPSMKPFRLIDADIQHYDYLVVRTTFLLSDTLNN